MKPLLTVLLMFSLALYVGAEDEKVAADEPVWTPVVGDAWVYKVVVEVPEGSELPEEVDGQKVEQLGGKVRATYTQTTVYQGLKTMKKDGPKVHAFHVSAGKQLMEIEYMKISGDSVEAAGFKHEGKKPKEVMSLSKSIPLVYSSWKGGEAFPFVMDMVVGEQRVRLVRKFKVLGWETIETQAGKFKALHVQVTGLNGPMEIKRSYWFTPQKGFIKEVKKYYLGDKTVFTQTRVLEKFVKAAPAKKSE